MTCIVLATLLLLALLAGWRGRRWLARSLLALALSLLLLAGCGPLPQWLLAGLQGPYVATATGSWAPRNVIVLLGAGTTLVGHNAVEPSFFADGRIVQIQRAGLERAENAAAVTTWLRSAATGHRAARWPVGLRRPDPARRCRSRSGSARRS
ncbi:MAG: hypothetical protein ACYCZD_05540 [Rhodanobacter sp.]